MGHVLPGSFFIVFGIWWTTNQFRRYYQSRLKNGAAYENSPSFKCFCLCGRLANWEMEGFLMIFFTTVGFMGEVITGMKNGQFVNLGNGQHATMFFFFGLIGVIELLLHYNVPLPRSTTYAAMALALLIEGVLFKFHLHGRADLDVVIHTLLVYAVFMNVLVVLIEMKFTNSIFAGLARSYFILLQGTWFWQVAFILYNPIPGARPWDLEDHEQTMIATMIFGWHMGANFIIQLLIAGVVACVYRCRGEFESNNPYNLLKMQLLPNGGSNGHAVVNVPGEESDSDIEFQQPSTRIPPQ